MEDIGISNESHIFISSMWARTLEISSQGRKRFQRHYETISSERN